MQSYPQYQNYNYQYSQYAHYNNANNRGNNLKKNKNNDKKIAFITVGTIVGGILISALIFFIRRNRNRNDAPEGNGIINGLLKDSLIYDEPIEDMNKYTEELEKKITGMLVDTEAKKNGKYKNMDGKEYFVFCNASKTGGNTYIYTESKEYKNLSELPEEVSFYCIVTKCFLLVKLTKNDFFYDKANKKVSLTSNGWKRFDEYFNVVDS